MSYYAQADPDVAYTRLYVSPSADTLLNPEDPQHLQYSANLSADLYMPLRTHWITDFTEIEQNSIFSKAYECKIGKDMFDKALTALRNNGSNPRNLTDAVLNPNARFSIPSPDDKVDRELPDGWKYEWSLRFQQQRKISVRDLLNDSTKADDLIEQDTFQKIDSLTLMVKPTSSAWAQSSARYVYLPATVSDMDVPAHLKFFRDSDYPGDRVCTGSEVSGSEVNVKLTWTSNLSKIFQPKDYYIHNKQMAKAFGDKKTSVDALSTASFEFRLTPRNESWPLE
ncbi:uncharacterized protein I206_107608 [Kwoniella pini CBS 10737]|uniref:Uncharacterized protein n=1 Tax=Kwoniella pini CBS 10737 TaxID=1296096 RepID=A0A1B9HXT5_9TREE|nr:uncharacterized protein I206_05941 [Kwoniella pini CBS 10737]OCF48074.1 hypothetical protein I206_05941 [Kwoniella pini CBS 10737]